MGKLCARVMFNRYFNECSLKIIDMHRFGSLICTASEDLICTALDDLKYEFKDR